MDNESFINVNIINFSVQKQEQIRQETDRDTTLQRLMQIVHEGWPDQINQLPPHIREYWAYRDELGIQNGILYQGSQNHS